MPLVLLYNTGLRKSILAFGWVRELSNPRECLAYHVSSYIYCVQCVHEVIISYPSQHAYSCLLPVFTINLLGVRVFGELEFWFSSIKSKRLPDFR